MRVLLHRRKIPANRFQGAIFPAATISFVALFPFRPAMADWPKPITPANNDFPRALPVVPPSAAPAPIGTSALGAPSIGSSSIGAPSIDVPSVALPLALNDSNARRFISLPPLMRLMQNGQLAPQKAWDDKLIGVDDLIWLLDKHIEPWGRFGGTANVPVRRELVKLLVVQGGDKWLAQASPTLRLWLADYYLGLNDARCVALCEGILREVKGPLTGDQPVAFLAVEWLSRFYAAQGDEAKGALCWLRVPDYYPEGSWWIADALIEAARQFRRAGDERRAGETYRRVMEVGGNYFGSGALKEQSAALIGQGKRAEALRWLEQLTAQKPSGAATSQYVAALAQLGYVHYLDGDWRQSRLCYEAAIAASRRLPGGALALHDLSVVTRAEAMLGLLAHWEAERIVCDPPAINIVAGREKKDGPITRRFLVSAPQEMTLEVGCNDPQIKVLGIEESPWGSELRPLRYEKQVVVEIAADALQNAREALLTVKSPQTAGYQAQVPLRVQMRDEAQ